MLVVYPLLASFFLDSFSKEEEEALFAMQHFNMMWDKIGLWQWKWLSESLLAASISSRRMLQLILLIHNVSLVFWQQFGISFSSNASWWLCNVKAFDMQTKSQIFRSQLQSETELISASDALLFATIIEYIPSTGILIYYVKIRFDMQSIMSKIVRYVNEKWVCVYIFNIDVVLRAQTHKFIVHTYIVWHWDINDNHCHMNTFWQFLTLNWLSPLFFLSVRIFKHIVWCI